MKAAVHKKLEGKNISNPTITIVNPKVRETQACEWEP